MPAVEVVTVLVHWVLGRNSIEYTRRHEVDAVLKALPRLREVHFGVQRGKSEGFETNMRWCLPGASETGLLSFSELEFPQRNDPMATFSN
jgi:hypothetical protein